MTPDASMQECERIVMGCRPHLSDHIPEIQGAALGELVALWLAGHPDDFRESIFANWVDLVRMLVEPVEAQLFEGRTHPQNTGLPNGGMNV